MHICTTWIQQHETANRSNTEPECYLRHFNSTSSHSDTLNTHGRAQHDLHDIQNCRLPQGIVRCLGMNDGRNAILFAIRMPRTSCYCRLSQQWLHRTCKLREAKDTLATTWSTTRQLAHSWYEMIALISLQTSNNNGTTHKSTIKKEHATDLHMRYVLASVNHTRRN